MVKLKMYAKTEQKIKPQREATEGRLSMIHIYSKAIFKLYNNFLLRIIFYMQNIAPEFPFQGYDWSGAQFKGEGSYGKVYQVRRIQSNEFVAIKQIDMAKINDQYLLDALINEINIMKEIASDNTVRLFDSSIGQNYSYMILELCDSDLRKKMETSTHCFTQAECLEIFGQIIKGIKVLVDHQYIHRDIKPANVLIKSNIYKIADYGFARKADFYTLAKLDEFCGTPIYMAPQLLCSEPYNAKCDIWSLGLLLYELLYGCPPWPLRNLESYIEAIKTKPLSFPYNIQIGNATRDFLIRSLTVNEENRMTWPQLFNHEIVKDKTGGEAVQKRQMSEQVQKILSRIQFEVTRKNIDLLGIFRKYEQFQSLSKNQFFAMLFEISPAITTFESRMLFDFCDANSNGNVEYEEFKSLLCSTNYHEDPVLAHEIDELCCIISVRKLNVNALFDEFDKNSSGALDHGQFRNFLRAIVPKLSDHFIKLLYKIFDKDGKGLIEKREFIEVVASNLPNSNSYEGIDMERAKRNFDGLKLFLNQNQISGEKLLVMADKNMDGHLDLAEFFHLMQKISFGITEEEIKWMFSRIDSNNSGSININELFAFIHL